MQRRFAVYALFATLAIGGIAFAADALVVSDAEQVEHIADALIEGPADERTDALVSRVDLTRERVVVSRGSHTTEFDESEDYALGEELSEALAPLGTGELEVVQRSLDVRGDRATLALRVRSAGELTDLTIDLAKSGQGWLVTRVRAR